MATYQIVERQLWRGQAVQNVHHYESSVVLSASQLGEVADALRAARVTLDGAGTIDNAWVWNGIDARRVDLPGLPQQQFSAAAGTYTGIVTATNSLPNQVCLLVSWDAPTTKPRRGRSYLGGMHADSITDGGVWNATVVQDAEDWANAVQTLTLTGDTLEKVAVLYAGTPPAVANFNVLDNFTVQANPAIQRRRRLGSGA